MQEEILATRVPFFLLHIILRFFVCDAWDKGVILKDKTIRKGEGAVMVEHILIVEDDTSLGQGLCLTLEQYACTLFPTLPKAATCCSGAAGTFPLLSLPDL